jgi:hypothetical protein
MTNTPHLALPLLAAAQAQKHVTHNEALALVDALVHLAVKERNRTVPPGAPEEGDRYLVGAGATGGFAAQDGRIAFFDLGIWRFLQPKAGWRAYVENEERIVVFDGAAWTGLGAFIGALDNLERLGIGTAADAANRVAAKLNAALFTALGAGEGGTGDLRFVLNKDGPGNVLSQLYQSGYGGRAETGLVGSDDFTIRVSADGGTWREALRHRPEHRRRCLPERGRGIARDREPADQPGMRRQPARLRGRGARRRGLRLRPLEGRGRGLHPRPGCRWHAHAPGRAHAGRGGAGPRRPDGSAFRSRTRRGRSGSRWRARAGRFPPDPGAAP